VESNRHANVVARPSCPLWRERPAPEAWGMATGHAAAGAGRPCTSGQDARATSTPRPRRARATSPLLASS
jgi:hypothetical protein